MRKRNHAMTQWKLTSRAPAARNAATVIEHSRGRGAIRRAWGPAAVLIMGTAMVAGCISVSAPDKPIVIELNINIKQEVIYRIADDVANTINQNPEIF